MQTFLPLALIPDAFLAPVAIGFTVAVTGFVLYWLVAAFGLRHHNPHHGGVGHSIAGIMLHFFFGHAPPILVLSLASLAGWVAAVALVPSVSAWQPWQQLLLDLPLLAGGLLVARLLAFPIGRVYQQAAEAEAKEQAWSPVGMNARVVSYEVCDAYGQVEVKKGGPSVLLNARAKPGQTFKQGDTVKVVSRDGGSGVLVERMDAH